MRNTIAGLLLAAGILCSSLPAGADPYADRGEALYKAGDYKNAGRYFAQSLQKNPVNSRALYMSALCLQGLGNTDAAKNGFQTLVQVFPTSPEASLAKQALAGHPGALPPAPASSGAFAPRSKTAARSSAAPHATTSSTTKSTVTKTFSTTNKKTSTECSTQSAGGQPSSTQTSTTSTESSGDQTSK